MLLYKSSKTAGIHVVFLRTGDIRDDRQAVVPVNHRMIVLRAFSAVLIMMSCAFTVSVMAEMNVCQLWLFPGSICVLPVGLCAIRLASKGPLHKRDPTQPAGMVPSKLGKKFIGFCICFLVLLNVWLAWGLMIGDESLPCCWLVHWSVVIIWTLLFIIVFLTVLVSFVFIVRSQCR